MQQVGARDDFFRIGGDSIHCIQMVARARQHGIVLTTQQVFATPMLADLAAQAGEAPDGGTEDSVGAGVPFALLDLSPERLERLRKDTPDLEDAYPLTPVQEGMLFHVLADPDPALYRDQGLATLRGDLDTAAFRTAWHLLAERHGALRTSFLWQGLERPIQRIHRHVEPRIEEIDWSGLESEEAERRVQERLERDRLRGMELDRPPLFHLSLARCPDEDGRACYRLLWTHHHLAHDAWSLEVLVRELLTLYSAERSGEALQLGPAPSYRRYVEDSRRRQSEAVADYWRQVYGGLEGPTPLFADRGQTGEPRHRQWQGALEDRIYRRLREQSRDDGITLATRIHAAQALLLATARSGSDAVVFGTVVAGRPSDLPMAEGIVGLFINTLPLRVPLAHELPVAGWLADLQERIQHLRHHEQTPLARVREASGLRRETPLFENVLVVQNVFSGIVEAAGLELSELQLMGHSNYPLMLRVTPGRELTLECLADVSRVPESRAGALTDQVAWLLELLTDSAAERTVGDLIDLLRQRLHAAEAAARSKFRRTGYERLRATARRRAPAPLTDHRPSIKKGTS